MTGRSIRVRLTAWYVVVLTVATCSVGAGSWWLLRRSVVEAADSSLRARFDGVVHFVIATERGLPAESVADELNEYADLNPDTLLQITDAQGVVLVRPRVAGWADLVAGVPAARSGAPGIVDRDLDGRPFRVAAGDVEAAGQRYEVVAALPMGPAEAALARFPLLLAA